MEKKMTSVQKLREAGLTPAPDHYVVTNNDGRITIQILTFEEFKAAWWGEDFLNVPIVDRLPDQDENGRWIGQPKKAVLIILGMVVARKTTGIPLVN